MGIKALFNNEDFRRKAESQYKILRGKIIRAFHYEGQRFIQEARNQPGDHSLGFYKDVTGNLRNSIQYFIFEDGELVEGSTSQRKAENLLEVGELVEFRGIQLIGIAGMNYASHVEAKGYNVISQQKEVIIIELGKRLDLIEKWVENNN